MSITVIRRKNGVEIPIKVSILDAFRSSPPKNIRVAQQNNDTKAAPTPKADDKKATSQAETKHAVRYSNHAEETYSAEDDATIIAMKAETKPTKSFKQILEAIGKTSESQLKEHWKQIRPQTGNDKKKEDESAGKAEAKKAEGLAKAAEAKSRKEGAVKVDGSSKKASKDAEDQSATLTKKNLKNFVARYEREKWLAAASRHYDLTGQRISPETAKKMAFESD